MADESVTHDDDEPEDPAFDHAMRIVDRVLESIYPAELPPDVDPAEVAYGLWLRLTDILFICEFAADDLIDRVREAQLHDAEPEGSA